MHIDKPCIIVTGGAGFIGSALIRHLMQSTDFSIVNIDKLTYAANLQSLSEIKDNSHYTFIQEDILNREAINSVFQKYRPTAVMHLAAESHVDRSIDGPAAFIQTNIVGTYNLLEAARSYWKSLSSQEAEQFRFHHISTDEVFGSLGPIGLFTEETPYQPNSPYSASKASSDMLVRAWHHTYGLPVLITNCSNNYGPWQFPEKLIPVIIANAFEGKPLPVYGDGQNIRDWLHVEDHVKALTLVLEKGKVGATYNIGGQAECTNLDLVKMICRTLDEIWPDTSGPREQLITFVPDRPGHDRRYAIDCSKIEKELGWKREHTLQTGLQSTVLWYLQNREWWHALRSKVYSGERLGLNTVRTNKNQTAA